MSIELKAQKREQSAEAPDAVRKAGKIPAVVYGPDMESRPIQVDRSAFLKTYHEAGETQPVNIKLGSEDVQVLIYDMQEHPVTGNILHVDFYHVSGKRPIQATVPVELTGESPAVKQSRGVLITQIRELLVEARLQDLPQEITGDLSILEGSDDEIKIQDLDIPDGVEVVEYDPEDIVATIGEFKERDEEIPAEEQEVVPEAIRVEQEGGAEEKQETEEPATNEESGNTEEGEEPEETQ